MKRAIILLGFLAILGFLFWKRTPHVTELQGSAMGTRWTLEWRGKSPPPENLKREVSSVLEHWEQVLSQWRPTSDLSRHNRGEPATPDLARVISFADKIKSATHGAFDHHLLGEVHAAGFGPEGNGIDLSSVGKGFAVDRVCERLRSIGLNDFVFALAGEVRAEGEWPIVIEKPLSSVSTPERTVTINGRSIATSGNYRQFRETPEGIVSHIIDPRTRKPVIRPFSSVTVIADDCATASAWATALFVLGADTTLRPADAEVIWQMEKVPDR